MTAIAEQLTTTWVPTVRERLNAFSKRFQPDPAAYSSAGRGLWGFAAAVIVVIGLFPFFASTANLLIAQQAIYLGLLALSLNLLVATTGLVSFGHAMFYALGAYMIGVPFAHDVAILQNPLFALALAPVIGAVAAFLIGFIVLRGRELYFALLTLGVGQLIWAVAHGWQSLTGGTNGIPGVFAADWLNPFMHQSNLFWFVFGIALVCAVLLYIITKSPFGDALRGIRENRRRAEFAGLWVKRYELTAFVIAGAFAAVAGGLQVIGETQINSAQVDWQLSALALIAVLLGGTRYFLGPFVGAFFFLFVFDWVIEQTVLWDTVLGIIVLAVALLAPGGIVGLIHWIFAGAVELWRRVWRAAEREPAPAVPAPTGTSEATRLPHLQPTGDGDGAAAARQNGEQVLDIKDVSKRFGGLVAVDQVNLTVRQGEFHAIIGPNGAGKTTLFNVITGMMKPDGGTVSLEEHDITGTAPWRLVKRGMGRSFQQTNLFWHLSSLTNLTVAESASNDGTYKIWGGHPQSVRDRAELLLGRVGLRAYGDVPAIELSHGDQRALEIASALAVESKLLLLDEPTAGLSPGETRDAMALIRSIATDQNLTVLFVEHDMDVVFGIADRITVLHMGAVLAEGTPAEIRANPEVQAAYLGEGDEEAAVSDGNGVGRASSDGPAESSSE